MRLAREAVTDAVRRAGRLAAGLEPGKARDALVHIAEFIAERCGATYEVLFGLLRWFGPGIAARIRLRKDSQAPPEP